MTARNYRTALDAALEEYEALGQQKGALDDRLAQLGQTIGTLTRLLGLTPTVPLGLTDACRMILRRGDPMTAVEVRDRLTAIGIDMSRYANDLAAVHTILKRLNTSGELRFISNSPGKHRYAWNGPVTPVSWNRDIVSVMHDATHEHEAIGATDVPDGEEDAGNRTPPDASKKRPPSRKKRR